MNGTVNAEMNNNEKGMEMEPRQTMLDALSIRGREDIAAADENEPVVPLNEVGESVPLPVDFISERIEETDEVSNDLQMDKGEDFESDEFDGYDYDDYDYDDYDYDDYAGSYEDRIYSYDAEGDGGYDLSPDELEEAEMIYWNTH